MMKIPIAEDSPTHDRGLSRPVERSDALQSLASAVWKMRDLKPGLSIRWKLAAAFMVVAFFVAAFVALTIKSHFETVERAARLEAQHVAELIADAIIEDYGVTPRPQEYVARLNSVRKRDVIIVDVFKRGLADADPREIGKIYRDDPGNEVGKTIRDGQARTFIEKNSDHPEGAYQIVVPLRQDASDPRDPVIGAVILEYTSIREQLFAAEREQMYLTTTAGIVVVLLVAFFGLGIAQRIAQPLRDLQSGVERIAAQDYGARVAVTSHDEIGVLGSAFNDMAEDLRVSHGGLIEQKRELEKRVAERTRELNQSNTLLQQEVYQGKQAEIRIGRLNRVYAVLSGINTLIVRVRDRDELFREACRIAVDEGGFQMSFIAIVDRTSMKIVPVASAGKHEALLTAIKGVLSSNEEAPKTLVAQAIREKEVFVSNDTQNDPKVYFGKKYADSGVRSMAVMPLIFADEVVGVLALYAGETGFFDEEEMKLLTELARDVAFAIDHIDKRERLDYLAYYDALTGLANRSLLLERVAQYMRNAASGGHKLAVFLFDLERFKNINDSLGRPAGDALLKQVAEWLTRRLGDASLFARIDADHFAIVLPKVKQDGDVARLVEKTLAAFLEHPFRLNDAVFRIAAKVGVALFPDDGADADTLFKNAEAALKKAKTRGDRYLFYTQAMTETVGVKLTLENQLRQALDNEEFVLHYQPKVSFASGKLTSAEALIRWNDPRTGLVPPGRFIPVLEETGLIFETGRWALRQAIKDYLRWRAAGLPAVRIAVNVSPLQLRSRGFVEEIKQIISVDAHAPAGLELEITESLIMEDVKHNIASLQAIRALGVTIAIDDFGTGFSSLAYLSKLPVDTLKIDRSFVIDMTAGAEGLALVSTIITLAHSLKLKVVAEGVETEEQSRLLRLLNCDEMQGFLFSKPVPGEIFETRYLAAPPAG